MIIQSENIYLECDSWSSKTDLSKTEETQNASIQTNYLAIYKLIIGI